MGCSRPIGELAAGQFLRQIRLWLLARPQREPARGSPDRTGDRRGTAVEGDRMINLSIPRDEDEMKPRITVVGVGGAGGNAVNNMIRSNLIGCEFVVCNTDAQALLQSLAERRIQLGVGTTRGLGAGSRPDVGRAAAEQAIEEIM